MSRSTNNSARLPLFEAVLAVALFALISVVILRLYMSADRIQGEAVAVSKAMIAAENAAERFAYDGSVTEKSVLDENFEPVTGDGRYELSMKVSADEGTGRRLMNAVITVRDVKKDRILCELNSAHIEE